MPAGNDHEGDDIPPDLEDTRGEVLLQPVEPVAPEAELRGEHHEGDEVEANRSTPETADPRGEHEPLERADSARQGSALSSPLISTGVPGGDNVAPAGDGVSAGSEEARNLKRPPVTWVPEGPPDRMLLGYGYCCAVDDHARHP